MLQVWTDTLQLAALMLLATGVKYALPLPMLATFSAFLPTPQATAAWLPAGCLAQATSSVPASILATYLGISAPLLVVLVLALWVSQDTARKQGIGNVPKALVKHSQPIMGAMSWYFLHLAYSVTSAYHCTSLPVAPSLRQDMTNQVETYSAWTVDPDVQCFKGHHAGLTVFVSLLGLPLLLAYLALHVAHLWPACKTWVKCRQATSCMGSDVQPSLSRAISSDAADCVASIEDEASPPSGGAGADNEKAAYGKQAAGFSCTSSSMPVCLLWIVPAADEGLGWWCSTAELLKLVMCIVVVMLQHNASAVLLVLALCLSAAAWVASKLAGRSRWSMLACASLLVLLALLAATCDAAVLEAGLYAKLHDAAQVLEVSLYGAVAARAAIALLFAAVVVVQAVAWCWTAWAATADGS